MCINVCVCVEQANSAPVMSVAVDARPPKPKKKGPKLEPPSSKAEVSEKAATKSKKKKK